MGDGAPSGEERERVKAREAVPCLAASSELRSPPWCRVYDIVFRNIWLRKSYHLAAGVVLIVCITKLPRPWLLGLGMTWLIVFGILSRRLSTAMLGLLLVNLVSGSRLVTLGATVVFVAGDAMSALIGSLLPVGRWPWNPKKTFSGSLSFVVFGALALAAVMWHTAGTTPSRLILLSLLPAVAGAVAEVAPWAAIPDLRDSTPDDNLAVTLASGGVLAVLVRVLGVAG